MRRVEHARAEDGKRPITRRRTIGGGNSPAVSRNYGILRDSLELLFLSFSFFFFSPRSEETSLEKEAKRKEYKVRREGFFFLRRRENY